MPLCCVLYFHATDLGNSKLSSKICWRHDMTADELRNGQLSSDTYFASQCFCPRSCFGSMVFRGLADSQVYRPKLEANQRRGRAGRTGPGAYGPQSFEQWEIRPGTHVTSM